MEDDGVFTDTPQDVKGVLLLRALLTYNGLKWRIPVFAGMTGVGGDDIAGGDSETPVQPSRGISSAG